MRPLGPLPCTRPRSTPSSRAKRRIAGHACTGPPALTPGATAPLDETPGCGAGAVDTGGRPLAIAGGAGDAAGDAAGAGADAVAGAAVFGAGAFAVVATVASTVARETLSPTFTLTSRIWPPAAA